MISARGSLNYKCGVLLALACSAFAGSAADKKNPDKAKSPDAPSDAGSSAPDFNNTWALNGPYGMAGLKGKVVVLYFYESG